MLRVNESDLGAVVPDDPGGARLPESGRQLRIVDFFKPLAGAVEGGEQAGVKASVDVAVGNPGPPLTKSFARVVGRSLSVIEDLPDPIKVRNSTKVGIPQEAYEKELLGLNNALIERTNFRFITLDEIRAAFRTAWRLEAGVVLSPLGRGFFLARFEKEGDMAAFWKRGSMRVGSQTITFQRWSPRFNPNDRSTSTKLVWIRFPDLPLEYWNEKIMLSMAKAVGRPVAIDGRTKRVMFGNFARALVEIDIDGERTSEIQVEHMRLGSSDPFWFHQNIVYEDELEWCEFCKKLGHSSEKCRAQVWPEAADVGKEGDRNANVDSEWEDGRRRCRCSRKRRGQADLSPANLEIRQDLGNPIQGGNPNPISPLLERSIRQVEDISRKGDSVSNLGRLHDVEDSNREGGNYEIIGSVEMLREGGMLEVVDIGQAEVHHAGVEKADDAIRALEAREAANQ
ncbi:uncharacterized protein LOC122647778 [Telopea speciosissima]|uniref:uncharacterized protein LOC122647778 n=1 Tax=Telopea speciosissima TaxID=54955 RepID=UPI001CC61EDD|nr:uncharacterized protein LOC122647778 [Telopea speciosissima]